jgi:Uma2 family endonuclease
MSGTMNPSPEGKLLMTTAPIYAQVDPWTIEDLDRLPDDVHVQILDGSLIVSPSPTSLHQLVSARLSRALEDETPPEFEVLATPGVQIRLSYLEPDIAVVPAEAAAANLKNFRPEHLRLVVEIVSPSNAGFDRREKPLRYAEAGIPHFWRVELDGDRSPYVVRHGLDESGTKYVELGTVWAGDEETVDIGFPVTLRPAEFLRRRKPRG